MERLKAQNRSSGTDIIKAKIRVKLKPIPKVKTLQSVAKGNPIKLNPELSHSLPDSVRRASSSQSLKHESLTGHKVIRNRLEDVGNARTPAQSRISTRSLVHLRHNSPKQPKSKLNNKYIFYQDSPSPYVPESSTSSMKPRLDLTKIGQKETAVSGEMEWDSVECKNEKNDHPLLERVAPGERSQDLVFIVVDTNIFISHLDKVEKLNQSTSSKFVIYVPWMVHQELDSLSKSKQDVRNSANNAILFLKSKAKTSSKIKYQSGVQQRESERFFHPENSDDKIILACIQLQYYGRSVTLFTDDRNLSNKATANSIDSISSSNFLKALMDESLFKTRKLLEPRYPAENTMFVPEDPKTVLEALQQSFDIILLNEAQESFGDLWLDVISVKPNPRSPRWTFRDMFFNFQKHWIAIMGPLECFKRSDLEVFTSLGNLLVKYDVTNAETIWNAADSAEKILVVQKANYILRSLMGRKYSRLIQPALTKLEAFEHNLETRELFTQIWFEIYRFVASYCELLNVNYQSQIVPQIPTDQRCNLVVDEASFSRLRTLAKFVSDLASCFQEVLHLAYISGLSPSHVKFQQLHEALTDFQSSVGRGETSFNCSTSFTEGTLTIESLFGFLTDNDNLPILENGNRQIQALSFLSIKCFETLQA